MNEFEKQLARQPMKSIPAEWRAEILKAAGASQKGGVTPSVPPIVSWLQELFWPCPQAWAALAGLWLVIAGIAFTMPDGQRNESAKEMAKAEIVSVAEQRRELAELLNTAADAPKQLPADRPRSDRTIHWKGV